MRSFRMARKQQNKLPERAGMCSVVISSMKFDNKSIWNNPKISVPKMCKIVVSWSLKDETDLLVKFSRLLANKTEHAVQSYPAC